MEFMVPPGLYAIGNPVATDPVLVTANYKMSFDAVRSQLDKRNVWLLVLETYGINVWCAAGKGTFGTGELVRRIASSGLAKVVTHRDLLLPILGAPGVAAHEVRSRSGFTVHYATIRAADLPEYLDNGGITTEPMRKITFSTYERLVLVPVELVLALKTVAVAGALVFLLIALASGYQAGAMGLIAYLGSVLAGLAVSPVLLPWLPGRSFAVKGAITGLAWSVCFYAVADGAKWPVMVCAALFLALPALSAFYMLNFTGCTTYTSRSGVKKEMRLGLPVMGGALLLSFVLLLTARFL